ncbi:MAG: sigma-70 family RNA polymerase sigma factor [Fimbriimonadaceae bacterium]|nr:sigma-70 family RNA polymerase sigma factor [Fimbriimonadaceae bacterium]
MPPPDGDLHGDNLPEPHEARLIDRCRRGDREAFNELIERYQAKVYNLAYRLLGDADEAWDVSQEAFLRIWRGIQKFHGGSALTTWVYRIVHNLCLDEMKKKRRRPQIVEASETEDGTTEALLDRLPDHSEAPEGQYLSAEKAAAVRRAIARLKPHHRDVLVLYDLEGFSYNEIAEVLRTNVGTIKSRLNRARLQLARELEDEGELLGDL